MSNVIKAFSGSRKFWLAVVALAVCTVFVALGKIESDQFLTMVLGIVGGLGALIGAEDMAAKHAGKSSAVTVNNAATAPPVAGESTRTVTESKTVADDKGRDTPVTP